MHILVENIRKYQLSYKALGENISFISFACCIYLYSKHGRREGWSYTTHIIPKNSNSYDSNSNKSLEASQWLFFLCFNNCVDTHNCVIGFTLLVIMPPYALVF